MIGDNVQKEGKLFGIRKNRFQKFLEIFLIIFIIYKYLFNHNLYLKLFSNNKLIM